MAMNYVIEKEKPDFEVRTDLALEERESFPGDGGEIAGVSLREWQDKAKQVKLTEVKILDQRGAKAMGKPKGTYITMEAKALAKGDEDYHREVSGELSSQLKRMVKELKKQGKMPDRKELHVLAVGLGNPSVTPDALGPKVLGNLRVNRNMAEEDSVVLSGIVPGVMAQTGMETVEIIKGIVRETKPDMMIAVDALAARSSKRLNRTIQITDTGINPGSGVGNHRNAITKDTVGIPVLAIGVPTVVDAATIVNDTMENLIMALESSETLRGVGVVMQGYNAAEKYELVKELISPHLNGLFVTPKDIDETVKRISYTISEALNMLFSRGHAHNQEMGVI